MNIETMTRDDFYSIKNSLEDFWGERHRTFAPLHHPMFHYSFGNTAFVIKEENEICGYLLGFYSQTEPRAYVHMINVKERYRNQGYARALYDHFIAKAKDNQMSSISAITSPKNESSIRFHKSVGMKLLGDALSGGVPVVKNYSGNGEDRVVFEMDI